MDCYTFFLARSCADNITYTRLSDTEEIIGHDTEKSCHIGYFAFVQGEYTFGGKRMSAHDRINITFSPRALTIFPRHVHPTRDHQCEEYALSYMKIYRDAVTAVRKVKSLVSRDNMLSMFVIYTVLKKKERTFFKKPANRQR